MGRNNKNIDEDLGKIDMVEAACRLVGISISERNIRFILGAYKALDTKHDLTIAESVYMFNEITKMVNEEKKTK